MSRGSFHRDGGLAHTSSYSPAPKSYGLPSPMGHQRPPPRSFIMSATSSRTLAGTSSRPAPVPTRSSSMAGRPTSPGRTRSKSPARTSSLARSHSSQRAQSTRVMTTPTGGEIRSLSRSMSNGPRVSAFRDPVPVTSDDLVYNDRSSVGAPDGCSEFSSLSALSKSLAKLFNSALLSDVVIEVVPEEFDGREGSGEVSMRIPAHRAILAGWSDVFQELLVSEHVGDSNPTVRIAGYPADTIYRLIEFCYTGTVRINVANCISLLAAARQFQVEDLRRFCEEYCLESLLEANVCALHEQARSYNSRHLQEVTMRFILENGDEVLGRTGSVEDLCEKALLEVLVSDELCCSEEIVFDAVWRWVRNASAQLGGEEGTTEELFAIFRDHIRYPLIPADVLRDVVAKTGVVTENLLLEALMHHAAPKEAEGVGERNPRFRLRKAPSQGRLRFSSQRSSARISLLDSDAEAVMKEQSNWRTVMAERIMSFSGTEVSSRKHYWEVEIVNTAERNIMIGVCRPGLHPEVGGYTTNSAWMYYCNDGAKFHENESEPFDGHSATAGDRIGCLLSYASGSLTFYKNGIKMGTAFTGLEGELCPCVDLYDLNDSVRIVPGTSPM